MRAFLIGLIAFVSGVLVTEVFIVDPMRDVLGDAATTYEQYRAKSQEAISLLKQQKDRDGQILRLIFGDGWDRTQPVLSVPVAVTAYTSRPQETDATPYVTADNSTVRPGIVAVSRDLMSELGLRFGQRIVLTGYGLFEVRDVMNRRYERRVDIWMPDLVAARRHGVVENVTMIWSGM